MLACVSHQSHVPPLVIWDAARTRLVTRGVRYSGRQTCLKLELYITPMAPGLAYVGFHPKYG
jgi:hypothetical protein